MTPLRLLPLAALAACAVIAPATASAATIGAQEVVKERFPVDMPGGYRHGEKIPDGHTLLRRRVALLRDDQGVPVRFTCRRRYVIRTLATNDPGDVGFRIERNQLPYAARRSLRMELFPRPGLAEFPARGRVYVLCRRR